MRARTPIDRDAVKLSVLIPVYNERNTIDLIIDQMHATPMPKEIICVDDHSTDGTQQILETLLAQGRIDQLYRHPENRGKGAAIRQALSMSTGNIVIVQDADLEYDPATGRRCSSRSSTAAPTRASARAFSADRTACCTTGTRLATTC